MGYLINPTAFRVGWTKQWINNYYIDVRYYPELLYVIFRVRLYILYLLKCKEWRRQHWLYSHYLIQKNYWGLSISIYYYDGPLETEWRKFAEKLENYNYKPKWKDYKRKFKIFNNKPKEFLDLYTALIFSRIYKNYKVKNIPQVLLKPKLFKNNFAKHIIKTASKSNKLNRTGKHLLLYYKLVVTIINQQKRTKNYLHEKNRRERGNNLKEICHALYYYARIYIFSRPYLTIFTNFLKYIIKYIEQGLICKVNFYMITNEHITANFLVIYITERIKQKYTVKFLMNPLMRELKRVKRSFNKKSRNISKMANQKFNEKYVFYRKNLYYLFRSYRQFSSKVFNSKNTLMNYDSLFIHYNICAHIYHNDIEKYFSSSKKTRYYGIARTSFSKRANITFFVKARNWQIYIEYLLGRAITYNRNQAVLTPDHYIFVRETINDYYENYTQMLPRLGYNILSRNISFLPVWDSIKIGLWGLIKYNKYNRFKKKLNRYYNTFNISKKIYRNAKNKLQSKYNGLLGFKIQFRGRFTRKQIAACYKYVNGKMPLTSIDANIDYAFRSVAIKNSAVGVKVWFYKGQKGTPFFCKII